VSSHPPISPRIGAVVRSPRSEVRGCRRCSGSLPAAVRAMAKTNPLNGSCTGGTAPGVEDGLVGPISVPGAGAGRRPGEGGLMALTGRAGKSCLGPSRSLPGSDSRTDYLFNACSGNLSSVAARLNFGPGILTLGQAPASPSRCPGSYASRDGSARRTTHAAFRALDIFQQDLVPHHAIPWVVPA
jgi:hypothetical protein